MALIQHKIVVLSGKGGVGKSTFTTQLALYLASDPAVTVGILDLDICGPSIPRMTGCTGERLHASGAGWSPVYVRENLCVVSVHFLLEQAESAVIWRGPKKNALIRQFMRDVDWGVLDYLVIDTPPGTSDEHLSLAQLLFGGASGALLVTTPQEVALQDVRKEVDFCRKVQMPILGVVENMARFRCPSCGCDSEIFADSRSAAGLRGGARLAHECGLAFLGSVPLDPKIAAAGESGASLFDAPAVDASVGALGAIVERVRAACPLVQRE